MGKLTLFQQTLNQVYKTPIQTSRQELMTHWKETMGTPEARHWMYLDVRQWVLEISRRVVGGPVPFFFIFCGVLVMPLLLPCSASMISASEYLLMMLPPPRRTWATM